MTMVKRYQPEFPYRPPGVSMAKADTATELAHALSTFRNRATDLGVAIQTRRGAQAGEAAGAAGNPELLKGLRQFTAFGRSYNTAAEAAYVARTQIDIDSTFTRLEQEAESDLSKFDSTSDGFMKGLMKTVDPQFRARTELMIQARHASARARVIEKATQKSKSENAAAVLASEDSLVSTALEAVENLPQEDGDAAIAAAMTDHSLKIAALVREDVIDPVQGEQWRQRFKAKMLDGVTSTHIVKEVNRLMDLATGDVELGDQALAALQERTDLSEAEKDDIRAQYREQRNLLEFERSRTHAQESADLARRLAADEHGPGVEREARRLYRLGAISVDEYEGAITASTRNRLTIDADVAAMQSVGQLIAAGRGLDPTDPNQRQALDKLFTSGIAQAGAQAGDARWQAAAVETAARTNVLPESAESWARVNLLSGDPTQASVAATFLKRVHDANPMAAAYSRDPKLAAFAEQLYANLTAGVPLERAYEQTRRIVYEMPEDQRKLLAERYTATKAAETNPEVLQSGLDSEIGFKQGFLRGSPPAPVAMQAEFDRLVSDFYQTTNGDLPTARRLAWESLKGVWAVTSMNGQPEITKYAPERMYPGITAEIIRADVAASLKAIKSKVDPASARIVESPATARTQGMVWTLMTVNEYGGIDAILGPDNRPLEYSLPLGDSFAKAQATVVEPKLKAARDLRDKRRRVDAVLQDMAGAGDEEAARLREALQAARE